MRRWGTGGEGAERERGRTLPRDKSASDSADTYSLYFLLVYSAYTLSLLNWWWEEGGGDSVRDVYTSLKQSQH